MAQKRYAKQKKFKLTVTEVDHERYFRAAAKHGFVSASTAMRYFFEVMHAEVTYFLWDVGGQVVCVGARDLERARLKVTKISRLLDRFETPVLMKRLDSSDADLTGAW